MAIAYEDTFPKYGWFNGRGIIFLLEIWLHTKNLLPSDRDATCFFHNIVQHPHYWQKTVMLLVSFILAFFRVLCCGDLHLLFPSYSNSLGCVHGFPTLQCTLFCNAEVPESNLQMLFWVVEWWPLSDEGSVSVMLWSKPLLWLYL